MIVHSISSVTVMVVQMKAAFWVVPVLSVVFNPDAEVCGAPVVEDAAHIPANRFVLDDAILRWTATLLIWHTVMPPRTFADRCARKFIFECRVICIGVFCCSLIEEVAVFLLCLAMRYALDMEAPVWVALDPLQLVNFEDAIVFSVGTGFGCSITTLHSFNH